MAQVAAASASPGNAAVRVQSLSQSGQSNVPPQYVQPLPTRPCNRVAGSDNIPSVDLKACVRVREDIERACRDWGAFHVTGHGVSAALMDRVRAVGRAFFDEFPMEEKLKYACDASSAATEGYGSRMLENDDVVLDWRDYFDHHSLPLTRRNPSRWPHHPPDYRQVMAEYSDQMNLLARKLLGLMSESLGLPASSIEEAVGEFYQNITISFYPPCPQPDLTLGLQAHSDMGAVTLLIQDDVGGLQVLKDGEWITVEPVPDAIVVILADQTEIITNGAYRSAEHRAITNASRARLSVATFHDPARSKKISPASGLVSSFSPPRYREVVYGDFVSSWYKKGPEGKRNLDTLLI